MIHSKLSEVFPELNKSKRTEIKDFLRITLKVQTYEDLQNIAEGDLT